MLVKDVLPFVIGSVLIILVILLSIRMQISTMQGLDELTVENNQRLGYKAAGSMHVLDEGDRIGVMTRQEYRQIKQNCAETVPGFGGEPLTLDNADCPELEIPLPVPLQIVEEDGQITNTRMMVGESSEGFN
ncbi:MAG: hypothetical protein ACI8Z7_000065 [Candidatus Nanohaloarchaea archaeon]